MYRPLEIKQGGLPIGAPHNIL